ncbi:MAG: alpha/beta hydrolase [Micavibrio sp.]|nr:alpha/beta hydrolase [Micavibrio sp.]
MHQPADEKSINLALQGGGSHGAFTWGVLDALLEDGRLKFESISATSAGSMNAMMVAWGLAEGGAKGRDKAREMLEKFWREVSSEGLYYSPVKHSPLDLLEKYNPFFKQYNFDETASYAAFEAMTSIASPYQFNPMNFNPLRTILERLITFNNINDGKTTKLYITATCVKTGMPRVFSNDEITIDVLMASAALPTMFQAVEIGNSFYWDGGYMGNPSLYPFFYESASRDILIVHVNPVIRRELPDKPHTIDNRVNEITFNASLIKELRALSFAKKLVRNGWLKDEHKDKVRDILVHAIRADDVMQDLTAASKFDTDWDFLCGLRNFGRAEAKKWLEVSYPSVNYNDTVDIDREYLDIRPGQDHQPPKKTEAG